jgi:hypothetical protein
MIDASVLPILFEQLRRTGRSLLQYAGESYPWVRDAAGLGTLTAIQHMISQEQQASAAIIKYLRRSHVPPPHLGPYPMEFTNFNFLAVHRLLELLVEHQAKDVAALEADLRRVHDPEARRLLQHLFEVKKRHLESLREMTDPAATATTQLTTAPV